MRKRVNLAFVLPVLNDDTGQEICFLQFNPHLNGYNFLGGHVGRDESFQEAALREVREETGETELRERWNVDASFEIDEVEWKRLKELLIQEGLEDGAELTLPFFSVRAQHEGDDPERLARIAFYRADIRDCPRLRERLEWLTQVNVPQGLTGAESSLCRGFTRAELIEEAWRNPDNPFLRFAVKAGVVELPESASRKPPHLVHPAAFETTVQRMLRGQDLVARLLGLDGEEALDVHLILPGAPQARTCIESNATLAARLVLRWSASDKALSLDFPYPVEGVFVMHSDAASASRGARWHWHPRMVARPGLWPLRNHHGRFLRLGLLDGRYLDVLLDADSRDGNLRKRAAKLYEKVRFSRPALVPGEVLRAAGLTETGSGQAVACESNLLSRKMQCVDWMESLLRLADKLNGEPGVEWLDEQDLRYQRLYTFSAAIAERLAAVVASTAAKSTDGRECWDRLCNDQFYLERRLAPVTEWRRRGWLHLFDPLNGLDALSSLTAFQRYNVGNKTLKRLPPYTRQNHPSMRGLVCPVDSPESEKVGITLNLARGVTTDSLGMMNPAAELGVDRDLGWAASLVPGYQHNDGARAMMGAKTLKQAVPVRGRDRPSVTTARESAIRTPLGALAEAGLWDSTQEVAPGVDLLVAYIPWYGLNYEDAIVANQRLASEGVLDWEWEDRNSRRIAPGFELMPEPRAENALEQALISFHYDEQGLHRLGKEVRPRSALAWFRAPHGGELLPVLCGGNGPGELVDIQYVPSPYPSHGGVLRWTVCRRRPLAVGDKLTGRYGNKGVVSVMLDSESMPRLPEDERLPEALRGRAVDLAINPHGVISRMNLGQLLETQLGLAERLGAEHDHRDAGVPAFDDAAADRLRSAVGEIRGDGQESLMDEFGRIPIVLPHGRCTERPITVGWQQFLRLPHIAADKAQVRPPPSPESRQLYSLTTGQPVAGLKRGGGQRVGEMEVWALAAHGAGELLGAMLGSKSDPSMAADRNVPGQTMNAIRDHFYALGIAMREDERGIWFEWVANDANEESGSPITTERLWTAELQGIFHCPKCNYRYPRPVFAAGRKERSNRPALTVADVLAEQGYALPSAVDGELAPLGPGQRENSRDLRVPLARMDDTGSRQVRFSCTRKTKTVTVRFEIGKETLVGFRQVSASASWKFSDLGRLPVSCPQHATSHLKADREDLAPRPVTGGLCDPQLNGGIDPASGDDVNATAYVALPLTVSYPKDPKRGLKFGKDDRPPELSRIPVLPLRYRYGRPTYRDGEVVPVPDDLTAKYVNLVRLANAKTPGRARIEAELQDIFVAIHKRLFGKYGLIRRAGLGRRVDASGRLVIVPDPELDWDQCALPAQVLAGLLASRIAEWGGLREFEMDDETVSRLLEALAGEALPQVPLAVKEHVLSPEYWRSTADWISRRRPEEVEYVRRVVAAYLRAHPETRILANRYPSLHRYSMMGFRPVLLDRHDELVLKINPLVCKGFAADFDGDEMTVHMPLSDSEHSDADRLRPTMANNLVSVADGIPVAAFDQDFVLGHWLISTDDELTKSFRESVDNPGCETCSTLLGQPAPWDKDHGERLLAHYCEEHAELAPELGPRWMRAAFEAVTEKGVSFGFLELQDLAGRFQQSTEQIAVDNGSSPDALGQKTAVLGDQVLEKLADIETQGRRNRSAPGYGFAAMAISGARGDKQARQVIAARGFLDPGATGFDPGENWKRFFGRHSLVAGMDSDSAFWLAMNSRSSMVDKKLGTPTAGSITRRLVLAAWGWRVAEGDCGTSTIPRRLSRCRWLGDRRICAVCYGEVPGAGVAPDGYPAGLLAAQSFGERGTQLSMQSFHTGQSQLSVDAVESLLNGRDPNRGDESWFSAGQAVDDFIERIQGEGAYGRLDKRHIELIWMVIRHSPRGSMDSAVDDNKTPLSALAAPGQWRSLLRAIREGSIDDLQSPIARTMVGRSPV